MMQTTNDLEFYNRQQKFERLGYCILFIFIFVVIGATALIDISGAVIAPGQIIQTGKNKMVQHPQGGPVGSILVENGALVKKGDILLTLDDADIIARKNVLSQRKAELSLSLDRLKALQTFTDLNFYHSKFQAVMASYPKTVTRQSSIYRAQKDRYQDQEQQLISRINGTEKELLALKKQISTSQQQLAFLDESITEISELFAENLVSKSRLTNLKREKIAVLTEIDALNLSKARSINALNDAKQALSLMKKEYQENLWLEIENTNTQLAETLESLNASNDALSRLEVTAPADGRIHELQVNNIDAVVSPGEVIMQIVPDTTGPIVNARVGPLDIEQVYLGQEARIRFDSFDVNTTPELKGQVTKISPDTTTDDNTGELYYSVILSLTEKELKKLKDGEALTGLPVSTMLTTNKRSILNYLTKPITSKMFTAFRDG